MSVRDGELMIVAPIIGGPGHRAGLRAGDRIRVVDGKSTEGVRLDDAVRLLRGAVGSQVVLTIKRADWDTPRNIAITREVVRVAVEYHTLGGHVGYVGIRDLQKDTPGQVRDALGALRSQGADRFVLDLRGNPGGVLSAAIEVAELFLPTRRLITEVQMRTRTRNMRFTAHAKSPAVKAPLVVLIDEGTAAGAEIIAAALQDWERATLVGTKSVGRTTIQSIIALPDGAQLRLTTARWFTPKGALLHQGLTPDVEVTRAKDEEQWFRDPERDSQLRRAVQVVVAQQLR
jgi:carboxyl-terminal processing protease